MKKSYLNLALMGLLLVGCGHQSKNKIEQRQNLADSHIKATLLYKKEAHNYALHGKDRSMEFKENFVLYYFDIDGNKDTAELLLRVSSQSDMCFLTAYNEGKIGKTQECHEWVRKLVRNSDWMRYCMINSKEMEK